MSFGGTIADNHVFFDKMQGLWGGLLTIWFLANFTESLKMLSVRLAQAAQGS